MNERIKELAEQAKFIAEETINKQISKNAELDAFAEKLVELVVRECMELNSGEMGFPAWQDLARIYREHFGVE